MYTGIEVKVEKSLSDIIDTYKKFLLECNSTNGKLKYFPSHVFFNKPSCIIDKFPSYNEFAHEIALINNLNINDIDKEILEYKNKKHGEVSLVLSNAVMPNGTLNAKEIAENFFPEIKADVFLSHSHMNEDFAIILAIALEKLRLKVFIDSCVWGHADELLRKIDDKYCFNEKTETYRYSYRNQSTAHVYMILNLALQKMIDKADLFLFLNTDESVLPEEDKYIDKYISGGNGTYSPWIASELLFSRLVRKEKKITLATASSSISMEALRVFHEVETDHLSPVTISKFVEALLVDLNGLPDNS